MKKALKIVIPILIILALLGGAYWYFVRYNPLLTADLLSDLGDSFASYSHPGAALRCYQWANELAPRNGALSLKLAEACRKSGNYTKTERVLVQAIRANPDNPELYVRLSKLFVEQDKLLDAQKMLNSITSEVSAAEIARRRPAPPVVSPEGNYYTDYITVEIAPAAAGSTCYYTAYNTDADVFPSLADAYTEPFRLDGGGTRVCAVAVSQDGLVSEATYVGYQIAHVVEDVQLHDAALEAYLRETRHIGSRTIRTDDLWGIESLHLPEGLTSTEDLSYFTGLRELVIWDKESLDYSFLTKLYSLRHLELDHCGLSSQDLDIISACSSLEELVLTNCGLSNITALGQLAGLKLLDLTDNSIGDAAPVAGMAGLEELYLGHNALTVLPDFSAMTGLKILDLSYNALVRADGIRACTALEQLNLAHNQIESVEPVSSLTGLTFLNASNNPIADVSSLAALTKLEVFLMQDCLFTDVNFLENIASIREINIDYNETRAVPKFCEGCKLETISIAHNRIEDVSGLAGLQYLTLVNADYNNIRDIDVLADCPVLAQVNVFVNYINDGGVLAEKGVVVNFKPPVTG